MQVFTQMTDLSGRFSRTAVALGTFDGVHIGHQHIIGQAVRLAGKAGGPSIVVTFSNHPLSVIDPSRCPPLIVTPAYKTALIAGLGTDVLVDLAFDHRLLELPPAAFIDLLAKNLSPAYIVVGPNYSFGYRGCGTPALLADAGRTLGFEVVVPPAVEADGTLVSSTIIRQLLLAGEVAKAASLLGRPFRVSGAVVTGEGRGRGLGFPTANLDATVGQVVPADGVYATVVYWRGSRYTGVANIGTNPTFKGKTRVIEVHILDFSSDLYGQTIDVDFIGKLREERTFAGPTDLTDQIGRDVAAARSYFK